MLSWDGLYHIVTALSNSSKIVILKQKRVHDTLFCEWKVSMYKQLQVRLNVNDLMIQWKLSVTAQ